jgi:alkanesulfonate monooxygenase SsuD/methylene tetrahydromethanopterin reductase-like flavin-dependent oxidoreductase (luciferase family)
MIEPHPPAPVPILCGGESDAALRRAARLCDGWVGYAYPWDDAVRYVEKLTALRTRYGRQTPFRIMLALSEALTPDLVERARRPRHHRVDVQPVGDAGRHHGRRARFARARRREVPAPDRAVRRDGDRQHALTTDTRDRRRSDIAAQ